MMFKVIDLIVIARVIKSCRAWLRASDTQILNNEIHITLLIIVSIDFRSILTLSIVCQLPRIHLSPASNYLQYFTYTLTV